jgi:hypothetical protein
MNVMIIEILSYSKVGRQAYEFREVQMAPLIEESGWGNLFPIF